MKPVSNAISRLIAFAYLSSHFNFTLPKLTYTTASALDTSTEKEIQRNILSPQTAAAVCKGLTTLMIAHRLSTARRADTILVLDKGQLIEQGTHDELLALGAEKGMYARMWRDQMEGHSLDELK